jgi:hypothetical protein
MHTHTYANKDVSSYLGIKIPEDKLIDLSPTEPGDDLLNSPTQERHTYIYIYICINTVFNIIFQFISEMLKNM